MVLDLEAVPILPFPSDSFFSICGTRDMAVGSAQVNFLCNVLRSAATIEYSLEIMSIERKDKRFYCTKRILFPQCFQLTVYLLNIFLFIHCLFKYTIRCLKCQTNNYQLFKKEQDVLTRMNSWLTVNSRKPNAKHSCIITMQALFLF